MARFFRLSSLVPGVVVASLVLGGGAAHAQFSTLNPGNSVNPLGIAPAGIPYGATLVGSLTSPFNVTNGPITIVGTLLSSVYRGGTQALGGDPNALTFYYQLLRDDTTSANVSLTSFSVNSFAGVATEVGKSGEVLGTWAGGGTSLDRSDRSGGVGAGIQFTSNTGVLSGNTNVAIIRTNATSFTDKGGAAVLSDSGVSANVPNVLVAVPPGANQIPEPGTLALAGLGLGALLARRRRR